MITDLMRDEIAKVLTLYAISPGSRYTREEIKQKTGMTNQKTDLALNALEKNKILRKKRRLIEINHENNEAKTTLEMIRKEYIAMKELPLKVQLLLIEVSRAVATDPNCKRAILYGSYSKLIYKKNSDVDIAIIVKNDSRKKTEKLERRLEKTGTKYGKTIHAQFFTEEDMKQKDPIIEEIKKNGTNIL